MIQHFENAKVISNGKWRNYLDWNELTPKQQNEFDWMDEEKRLDEFFIPYRGNIYAFSEFLRFESENVGEWQGYQTQSAWDAVVVQCNPDDLTFRMGRYIVN